MKDSFLFRGREIIMTRACVTNNGLHWHGYTIELVDGARNSKGSGLCMTFPMALAWLLFGYRGKR